MEWWCPPYGFSRLGLFFSTFDVFVWFHVFTTAKIEEIFSQFFPCDRKKQNLPCGQKKKDDADTFSLSFFFACILCLYVVLFPRHTDTHRLHGRVVRAWKLNSRSLNKRRTARASPHPGKRNKKTGLSSDRAEMRRWEYCRVKVFIIFFPVQRRNKRVSFHSFRWRPVRHSKVRAVGQVLNILFFFFFFLYT